VLFSVGQGLLNTVVVLRLSSFNAGVSTSVFAAGMLFGSFQSAYLIYRFGRSRVYAVFMILFACTSILFGLSNSELLWHVLRFLCGYAVAPVHIIAQSSLLNISTRENCGRYLALYGISVHGATALSQLLLDVFDINTIAPFIFVSLVALLAVIPIQMIYFPVLRSVKKLRFSRFKKLYAMHPDSVISCLAGGMLIASTKGLLPGYIETIGFSLKDVAFFMLLTIGGGVVLRYPVGCLSDLFNDRIVAFGLFVVSLILSCVMLLLLSINFHEVIITGTILFLLGGALFSVYPTSMTYLCECIHDSKYSTEISQGLLLSFTFGAIIGPTIISSVIYEYGVEWLFSSFAVALVLISAYLLIKILTDGKFILKR